MSYSSRVSRHRSTVPTSAVVIGVVILAVVGVLAWLWGLDIVHWFTTKVREHTIFWVPFAGAVAAFIVYIVATASRKLGVRVAAIVAMVALVAVAIVLAVGADYQRKRIYYTESTTKVESVAPDYADRTPYDVANKTSDAEMRDLTGDASSTKALSDRGDHGLWNTIVYSRGLFEGHEAVQEMNLSLFDGKNEVTNCRFDAGASLRDGGALPHNNLSRAIYGQVPLDVDFQSGDVYGYCQDDAPFIAVPLTQVKGFWYPVNQFFGVALYNGKTGDLTIADSAAEVAAIPGPVYPQSLAATQREALAASGDWYEMSVAGTSGYTAAAANTEVQLRRDSGTDGDFVTTLTPRGSSKSIVGVSYVEATTATPGKWNKLTVALLPDGQTRASNTALTDSLRGRYSNITDIATDALQVFEITASTDGQWVLTLGRELAVSYRAYVSADGKDITLVNRNGDTIAQNYAPEDGESTGGGLAPVPGADLGELTAEDLNTLGKAIMDELSRRADTTTEQ